MKIQKPTICRIVEVALRDTARAGLVVHRPAIVTNHFGADTINCAPVLDGLNDAGVLCPRGLDGVPSLGSISFNAAGEIPEGRQATWRYPARCDDTIDVVG